MLYEIRTGESPKYLHKTNIDIIKEKAFVEFGSCRVGRKNDGKIEERNILFIREFFDLHLVKRRQILFYFA